MTDHKIRHHL